MIHGGVRWKRWSSPTSGWICGTNWIDEAPVPMTATRSPSRSWSWFQVGGVEDRAGELVEAGDVGEGGVGQRALGGDEHAGGDEPLARRAISQRPDSSFHAASSTLVSKETCGVTPRSSDDALEVVPDLVLGRERLAPLGVEREGEGVEVARDVAGAARVGVVAPGAADVGAALEDREVVEAGVHELDGHGDAREAGADDRDVGVRGVHGGYVTVTFGDVTSYDRDVPHTRQAAHDRRRPARADPRRHRATSPPTAVSTRSRSRPSPARRGSRGR